MADEPLPNLLSLALTEHLGRLRGYLLVLGADQMQVDEVIQELALSAADAAEVPDNPLAWLLVAARRRFVDLLRRRTVRQGRELPIDGLMLAIEETLSEEDDKDDEMAIGDLDALRRCLRRLAPRARELIDLRYWSNLSPADIATRLGWGSAAVRVALSKARRTLEDCMRRDQLGRDQPEPVHD